MTRPTLKYVPYNLSGHDNFYSQVAYVVLEDKCIFTAADTHGISTINAAESVLTSICRAIKSTPQSLRWFDLQSHYHYGLHSLAYDYPGNFEFEEVVFDTDGWAKSWVPTICPQHIIDIFKWPFIPGEPQQAFTRDPKEAQQVEFYDWTTTPLPPRDKFAPPPAGLRKLAEAVLRSGAKCWECRAPLTIENIRFRDDPYGWKVQGLSERQWLWFECSTGRCRYQTSFTKLKIPGKAGDEHHHLPGKDDEVH